MVGNNLRSHLEHLQRKMRDAAADLGASPGRVLWHIDLRLALRPVLAAAGA